jgi:hypothetical protein
MAHHAVPPATNRFRQSRIIKRYAIHLNHPPPSLQEMALKNWMRGGGSARDKAHEKISRDKKK